MSGEHTKYKYLADDYVSKEWMTLIWIHSKFFNPNKLGTENEEFKGVTRLARSKSMDLKFQSDSYSEILHIPDDHIKMLKLQILKVTFFDKVA